MAAPPGSRIVTPEAVVLEFEPAGVASRLLAYVLDLAVQLAVLSFVLNFTSVLALGGEALLGVAAALTFITIFLTVFGYPVAFETFWRGRTLGKAALGLRVVTVEGAPVTFRHAAIRSMFSLVDIFATFGLIGILSMIFTRRSQRLGDLVAGTLLLRERTTSPGSMLRPVRFSPPPGLEGYATTLATGALSHEDYGTIRSFLLRAASLPADARGSLAAAIGQPIADRLRVTPPATLTPELFLVCVAAAYQRRMDGPAARAGGTSFQSVWAGSHAWSTASGSRSMSLPQPPSAPPAAGGYASPA